MEWKVDCPICNENTSVECDYVSLDEEIVWENTCDNCGKEILLQIGGFVYEGNNEDEEESA